LSTGELLISHRKIEVGNVYLASTKSENPDKAWCSISGATVASTSRALAGNTDDLSGPALVDQLMRLPFLEVQLLDPPRLRSVSATPAKMGVHVADFVAPRLEQSAAVEAV
jgi:hypothetical protein